jgi:hypothetical protein
MLHHKKSVFFGISCFALLFYGGLYFLIASEILSFEISLILWLIFFLATPILAILFGFYSYAITKRVFIPHLCLFLICSLFMGGIHYLIMVLQNREEYSFYRLLDSVPFSCLITGLSLITSLVAMWEYKSMIKKAKRIDVENGADNDFLIK